MEIGFSFLITVLPICLCSASAQQANSTRGLRSRCWWGNLPWCLSDKVRVMMKLLFLAIVVSMSTLVLPQSLTPPKVITDPKQITAKPDADVEQGEENLSLERLYMTRQVGDTAWSPDGKSIVFVSNITGRNNLWLVPAEGGWPTQLTVSDQRQTHPTWSGWEMDCLSVGLRRGRAVG